MLELFVAQQVDLRILTLPDELDPCEFLLERGGEAFRDLLETETVDALDHAIRAKTRGIDLAHNVHAASQALEQLVAILAKAPRLRQDTTGASRLREAKILEQLASRFRVPEAEVRRHLTAVRRKAAARSPSPSPASPAAGAATAWRPAEKIEPGERELLELLLGHSECWPAAVARLRAEHFLSPACRRIYETCLRLLEAGVPPEFDRLMLELDEPALKNLLIELDESEQSKHKRLGDPPALLEELINTFWKRRPKGSARLRAWRFAKDA